MAQDSFKPIDKKAKGVGGDGPNKFPIIGIVKDNIDPTRSGRIRVALQNGKGSVAPNDASGWVTVQHLTTFFGVVRPSSGEGSEDFGSYVTNSSSYGQWQAPPDIGTKVLCIFVNGDPNAGFYIGSIPEPETLQMVPAIGARDVVTLNEGEANSFGGATRLPVTNLNTNNAEAATSDQFLDTPRPVHSYAASIMAQQGIIRDPLRGPISSSASREPASRVGWGVSTPGRPIYEGGYDDETLPQNLSQENTQQLKVIARRGGHTIVMDDGDIIGRDQLIRIRTALGHQILMSDDGQTLMILHSNGQSYIELGKEGTVDIFSTNSINMRTQGDFNIHADRDVNIHAMENLNLQGKNIHTNSEEEIKVRAGKNHSTEAFGNFTVKATGAFAARSDGQASLVAGSEAFVNGSKVNLNSGSPGLSPPSVPIIPLVAQTDTLFDRQRGWAAAPGRLLSIASRAPAHYPWAGAGMGVDIRTSGNATDNLPTPSSDIVQNLNNAAAASGVAPTNSATVSSVPAVNPISNTVDRGTTSAVLASVADAAATGPAAAAVAGGAAILPNEGIPVAGLMGAINQVASTAENITGQVTQLTQTFNNTLAQAPNAISTAAVAVGSFAQTPEQLMQSGILKPGTASLVNGLVNAGRSITDSIPDSLFTGGPGAESLMALAQNTVAQTESIVSVMQSAQNLLGQARVLSGRESPTQSAGLIAATATAGLEPVLSVLQQSSNSLNSNANVSGVIVTEISGVTTPLETLITGINPEAIANEVTGQLQNFGSQLTGLVNSSSSVIRAIGSGNAAANLAVSLGGLGGIANALRGFGNNNITSLTGLLDSVKGIAGSAYSTIINGFPTLEANVPQYLSEFARRSATRTAIESSTVPGSPPATNLARTSFTPRTSSLVSQVSDVVDSVAEIAGVAQNITNATTISAPLSDQLTPRRPDTVPITRTLTAIAGELDQTLTNASAVVNLLGQTASGVANSVGAGNSVNNAINRAVNQVNGLAGAATSIVGGLTSLSNAATFVQSGAAGGGANALASGLTNLAGGMRSISSVINRAPGAINAIPGTGELTGVLREAQTNVMNGLSTATSALNQISSISNSLGGISSAIASGLSAGSASQLLSSLSALGQGGAVPIRLVSQAINTFSRIDITPQITSILNDPKIPAPNFVGEIRQETVQSFEQIQLELRNNLSRLQDQVSQVLREERTAYATFLELSATRPAGDPSIDEARRLYYDLRTRSNSLINELGLPNATRTINNSSGTI